MCCRKLFTLVMILLTLGVISQQGAGAKMAKNDWQDIGTYQVWNWASDTQSGLGGDWAWGGDIDWYWFSWNQTDGDNLQSVGRGYANYGASPGYGTVWVDSLPVSFSCAANAAPKNVTGDYCFGLYGWLTPQTNSSTRGTGADEFYISIAYSASAGPNSSDRYLGNVKASGITFRCYERPITWGAFRQFRAYAVTQSWNGNINIMPIVRKWRAGGMSNAVLDELNWTAETYGSGSGEIVLGGISIPTPSSAY